MTKSCTEKKNQLVQFQFEYREYKRLIYMKKEQTDLAKKIIAHWKDISSYFSRVFPQETMSIV